MDLAAALTEIVAAGVVEGMARARVGSVLSDGDRPDAWSVEFTAHKLGYSPNAILRVLDAGLLPELPRWTQRRLVPRRAVEMVIEATLAGFDPAEVVQALRDAS